MNTIDALFLIGSGVLMGFAGGLLLMHDRIYTRGRKDGFTHGVELLERFARRKGYTRLDLAEFYTDEAIRQAREIMKDRRPPGPLAPQGGAA